MHRLVVLLTVLLLLLLRIVENWLVRCEPRPLSMDSLKGLNEADEADEVDEEEDDKGVTLDDMGTRACGESRGDMDCLRCC